MKEDYKQKFENLTAELRWFEDYHRTMAKHYREYGRADLQELHMTAWSEIYMLMEKFDIKPYDKKTN